MKDIRRAQQLGRIKWKKRAGNIRAIARRAEPCQVHLEGIIIQTNRSENIFLRDFWFVKKLLALCRVSWLKAR